MSPRIRRRLAPRQADAPKAACVTHGGRLTPTTTAVIVVVVILLPACLVLLGLPVKLAIYLVAGGAMVAAVLVGCLNGTVSFAVLTGMLQSAAAAARSNEGR